MSKFIKTRTSIVVRTSFAGLHCWPEAPDEVDFLRFPHRHLFDVRVTLDVSHADREKEFFIVKDRVQRWIRTLPLYKSHCALHDLGQRSCEMLGAELAEYMQGFGYMPTLVVVIEGEEDAGAVHYQYLA